MLMRREYAPGRGHARRLDPAPYREETRRGAVTPAFASPAALAATSHQLEARSLAALRRHPADVGVGALHRARHAVQAVRRAKHDLGVVPPIDLAGAEMSARVGEPLGAAQAQRRVRDRHVRRLILTVD